MADGIVVTDTAGLGERSPDEILRDIAIKRAEIVKTVARLGDQMEEMLDWRLQVVRHPYLAVTIAAGVGFWLSRLVRSGRTTEKHMLNMVSDAVVDVVRGVRRSVKDDAVVDRKSPPTFTTILGTAAVRMGTDLLVKKISEAVSARRAPHNGSGPSGAGGN